MRGNGAASGVEQMHALASGNVADDMDRPALFAQARCRIRRQRERQDVVIASGKGALQAALRTGDRQQRTGQGDSGIAR